MPLFRRRVTSAQLRDRIFRLQAQLPELQRNAVEQSVAIVEDETSDRSAYLAARQAVADCRDEIRLLEGQMKLVERDEDREREEAERAKEEAIREKSQKDLNRLADQAVKQARQVQATLANYQRAVADLLDTAKSLEQIAPIPGLAPGAPRNLSTTLATLVGGRRVDPDMSLGSLLATADVERPRSVHKLIDTALAKGDASMLIEAFVRARDEVVPGLIERRYSETQDWRRGENPHTTAWSGAQRSSMTEHHDWEPFVATPSDFPTPEQRAAASGAYRPSDFGTWPPAAPSQNLVPASEDRSEQAAASSLVDEPAFRASRQPPEPGDAAAEPIPDDEPAEFRDEAYLRELRRDVIREDAA